jgi:DNA-binding CsgD family transcriptional regulator
MDLLERDGVLRTLASHLDVAAAGRGRVVLLRGEAGIGKTSVVRRFAERMGDRARVLIGGCDPLSTPRPLGPLVDVADSLGPAVEATLDAALAGTGSPSGVFRSLLNELGDGGRPTVLVFEDVHWADGATFDLLRYLARRIEAVPALLVATYRDDEVGHDHPLAVVLGDLAGCPAMHRCTLEPLSPAAVGVLAGGRPVDVGALHRIAGGNPFFVTEVLAAGGERIPNSVRDAVIGRLARLAPAVRAVAEAVAVVGSPAPLRLVTAVMDATDQMLEEALDGAVLHVEGQSVAFRHELARMAVLDAVPGYRRARLHARVLAALRSGEVASDDLARLAYHAEEAADRDAVLEYAPRAAAHASALGAHREAAAQYRRALRHAATLPAGERAALLEGHAFSCYLMALAREALDSWDLARQLRHSLRDRVAEGDDLRWTSYMLWLLGRNGEARDAGLRAVRLLEAQAPGMELARAYVNLAEQSSYDSALDATLAYADRAVELGHRLAEPDVVVRARFHAAIARVFCRGDGWEEVEQTWRIAEDQGMVEHAGMIGPVACAVAVVHRDLARADRYADRAAAYCRDYDLDMFMVYLRGARAMGLAHRGRWDEAADEAAAVLRLPSLPSVNRIFALVALALVRARRGDPEVWPLLDEAAAGDPTDLIRLGPAWEARAEASWLAGDDATAIAEAERGLAVAAPDSDPWAVGGLARWVRLAGGATPTCAAAGPYALELAGEWQAAADAWTDLGCPYDAALALLAGDVTALSRALATFDALEARPAAARARERLRALGVRYGARGPRAATRAHQYGLTSREQEVLALLREGLSGPQIAARLHISRKTAGHHVTAILAKLRVHSRDEAVRKFDGDDAATART